MSTHNIGEAILMSIHNIGFYEEVKQIHHISIIKYYRVIALISADIVPSLDIEGRELESVRRYPNEGQYLPISV